MKILLIRHGLAEEPASESSDAQRELTKEGRKQMKQVARGLHKTIETIDALVSSPLTRAVQTAEIVAAELDSMRFTSVAALSPGKPVQATLDWIRAQKYAGTLALVGHEPHLSTFASWLMTGLQESFIDLKKAGACFIDMGDHPSAGHGELIWLMKPGQLKKL